MLASLPTRASSEPTIPLAPADPDICYLQTSDGRVVNLNQLCSSNAQTAPTQFLVTKQCAGCNLQQANLANRDLRGANLAGANLAGANLAGANLAGANLRGANIQGANLRGANIRNTILPGGLILRR
ncbi:MAG TPA: pentapeptide repeat-containing protein [Coleofasciculaceae cyanobacterium]